MDTNSYESITEFVVIGDFGFRRVEGPFSVEKSGTKWTITVPTDSLRVPFGETDVGHGAALIADGQAIGGGVVDTVFDPADEAEQHVIIDQYARGGPYGE